MNIVCLLDGFGIGGTELNFVRTIEALARRDVRVTILHFHPDGPLRQRIADGGHRLIHVPIVPLTSPKIALRVLALAHAIRRERPTVIHAQDVYTNVLGAAACRLVLRRPLITSRRWKDDVPRKGLRPLNAWAHRQSALVLPNSAALIPTLAAEGVARERIRVHENFIDDQALTLLSPAEIQAWRTRLGIPLDALVIGCVARLNKVKRHDVLMTAFAHVRAEQPNAHLVLVGDGDQRPGLEAQADALHLRDAVTFTGTLPNYPLSQQLFDIAVLTSGNEGFPNSLVEASAAGLPIVSTSVGGVPDVLIEGETGLTIAVGDAMSTAEALLSLARDAERRARFGTAGRALVQAKFSESAAIERLLGIYRSISR